MSILPQDRKTDDSKETRMRLQNLVEMLERHRGADAAEETHRRRMLELAGSPGDPFYRKHFVPGHFTASAFILSPDRSSLLLIYHSKLHRWLQPGGHVEPGDADILAAAGREIVEEVGMAAPPLAVEGVFDVDIHPIPARKDEPEHEHFDVRFLFQAPAVDVTAGSDATECRWVPLEEVTVSLTDASVMRAVAKVLSWRA
jgi:8-oxo-dGTP pyrophosphatase MutT (NUDIX family)